MKKSKVVLVLPMVRGAAFSMMSQAGAEHLGLGYLAAYLRDKSYEVAIKNFQLFTMVNQWEELCDSGVYEKLLNECAKEILALNPDIVGISVTGPTMDESLKMCEIIKTVNPSIITVLGGHQVSVLAQDIIRNEKDIDYIIIGDGEITLYNFVKAIDEGTDLSAIPGLCFRHNGCTVHTGFPAQLDLDKLPNPSRDSLQKLKSVINIKEARLSTSRGCLDACTFCVDSTLYKKNKWIARSPESVVNEMEYLHKEFGIEVFWIIDDNYLNSSPKSQERAKIIAEELIKRNLNIWYRAYFRADGLNNAEHILPLLRKSGLRLVHIGFESGCQCRLDYFRKRMKVEQYYRIAKLLKENNIGLQIGFILFDPFTTFNNIREDVKFLFDIGEMYIMFNFVQNLQVFPGTTIYGQLESEGLVNQKQTYKSTLKLYDYKYPAVKNLADAMEEAYCMERINVDKEIQRYNIIKIPCAVYQLESIASSESGNYIRQKVQSFIREKNEILDGLNAFNYKCFLKIIDMAETRWNKDFFDSCIGEISNCIVNSRDSLKELYNGFVSEFLDKGILSESGIF